MLRSIGIVALGILGLVLLDRFDFLLFHYIVEFFSVIVAGVVFVIAWESRERLEDDGLYLIGVGFLFVGGVDLLHTLSYRGTGMFQEFSPDMPTQLWIIARTLQAVILALGLGLRRVPVSRRSLPLILGAVTALLLLLVYPLRVFPTAFEVGVGLTRFKIVSEYVIILILLGTGFLLYRQRNRFSPRIVPVLLFALLATAASELFFTFYVDVYDLSNVLGHLLKVVAFILIYRVLVIESIRRPHSILYYELAQREAELKSAVDKQQLLLREMHHRVKNNLALVRSLVYLSMEEKSPDEGLRDIDRRINSIELIHDRLSRTETSSTIELGGYLNDLVHATVDSMSPVPTTVSMETEEIIIESRKAISVAMIVSELVTNAIKHGFRGETSGEIRISLRRTAGGFEIGVTNSGNRFSAELPSESSSSESVGASVVASLVKQLDTSLTYRSTPETTAILSVPI